tara:strand:- start:234 stop:416 length:183 start_codon:yes stop_codon:yes gene_type:complete
MKEEDWQNLEDIKNDFEKLRCGNITHASDKELNEQHILNQMRCYARNPGHLNWEVLNRLR